MAYYSVCDRCGASLDPGETCDCEKERERERKEEEVEMIFRSLYNIERNGQLRMAI